MTDFTGQHQLPLEDPTIIRLAVHGAAGRMGALLCELARDDPRFELVAQIDLKSNNDAARLAATRIDVVVDFSSDQGATGAVNYALQHGSAVLVATTGLSRQTLEDIELAAESVPVMIAPNTSFGVAVANHLAGIAAGLLGTRATVNLVETHHVAKRDAPSGTALRIAETLRRAGADLPAERIRSIRTGAVVGEHTVEFSAPGELIKICHIATNRDLFARGALDAAAWLHGRPPGRYSIEQALGLSGA